MNLTWDQLATLIAKLSPEQRSTNVTAKVGDEFYPVQELAFNLEIEGGVTEYNELDANHPFLMTPDS